MQIKTDGIVLKTTNYNEDDRLLTILTRGSGVVFAYAVGARKMRSRLANAATALCYADFELFKSNGMYTVDHADVKTLFFGARTDLDRLASASYFSELAMVCSPAEEPAEEILRLLLNTLHMLSTEKRMPDLLKPVFELRLMSITGYRPDLVACSSCGDFEHGPFWFSPERANVLCEACVKGNYLGRTPLSMGAFAAARHIVYAPIEKLFSFALGGQALVELSNAAEMYVLIHTDGNFATLDFLKGLK